MVDGLAEALVVARGHGDTIVLDLENTLVGYGSSVDDRRAAMAAALAAVAEDAQLRRVAFVSNARFVIPEVACDGLVVHTVGAARKPYVRLPPLRRLRDELAGAAVYGDQPLTDGRLAHNLGGIWLQPRHAFEPDPDEPWWPRVMRRRGERAVRRHFALVS